MSFEMKHARNTAIGLSIAMLVDAIMIKIYGNIILLLMLTTLGMPNQGPLNVLKFVLISLQVIVVVLGLISLILNWRVHWQIWGQCLAIIMPIIFLTGWVNNWISFLGLVGGGIAVLWLPKIIQKG